MKCVMDKEKKDIFYSKDLEAFLDIALRNLEATYNNNLRCHILDVLEKITKFDEYYGIMYKTKELQDLLDDYIKNDKVSGPAKSRSRKVLNNLVTNLKKQLLKKSGITPPPEDDEEEEEEDEEAEDEEQEAADKK